jgi:PIN domain nuclease of toxin-antitoxin system
LSAAAQSVRFLIDTNILIWALDTPEKLKQNVAAIITDPDNDVFVSVISLVEMRVKYSIGKLSIPARLSEKIIENGYAIMPLLDFHTSPLSDLPLHHRDPFDRILIAQAHAEGLTLVTADIKFREYQINMLIN